MNRLRPGLGQVEPDQLTRDIMDLPRQLPPVMTSLKYQPGFTPVSGKPGQYTVSMAPGVTPSLLDQIQAWLEKNKTVVYISAVSLLGLAVLRRR